MSTAATAARKLPLGLVIVAGCAIAAIGFGVRSSMGLFTVPMTADLGLTRESYGLAMAIQNLMWGIMQPVAGGLADRYGTARVLAAGVVIYALGVLGMAFAPNASALYLTAGLVTGTGIATASFGIVMAAFGRAVPAEKRSLVFGLATAASSLGQFLFAPLGQAFISAFGWQMALVYLAALLALAIPMTAALRGKADASEGEADMPFMQVLARAWGHNSYRLLVIGFFVCGFHLAFITVHMPAYLVQSGLPAAVGSWSIALIGLFNVIGSLSSGYLGNRMPKHYLLAAIYFGRAVLTALFLVLPVTTASAYLYAAGLGLLWLATVPPTAGLVALFFGARYLGMLYGVAFLSHQIGGFIGVWLGGWAYDHFGNYDPVWYLGIALGLGAAAIHLPIAERKSQALAAAPAQ